MSKEFSQSKSSWVIGQCVVGCYACPAVDWWQSVFLAYSRSTEINSVVIKLDEHKICTWMNVDTLYVAVLQICFAGEV